MRSDTRYDRLLLFVARRAPYTMATRLHRLVQDHRLDRAMAARDRAVRALRDRR